MVKQRLIYKIVSPKQTEKTVRIKRKIRSQAGELNIETPRDRDGSFEPVLVNKWQRELTTGLDEVILSFYAQGQSKITFEVFKIWKQKTIFVVKSQMTQFFEDSR